MNLSSKHFSFSFLASNRFPPQMPGLGILRWAYHSRSSSCSCWYPFLALGILYLLRPCLASATCPRDLVYVIEGEIPALYGCCYSLFSSMWPGREDGESIVGQKVSWRARILQWCSRKALPSTIYRFLSNCLMIIVSLGGSLSSGASI